MKRLFTIALCLLLTIPPIYALEGVQDDQNTGPITIATDTISIPATGKTNIGQYVPKHAVGVKIYVFGSDCIVNSQTNLASGSIFVGDKIASGAAITWTGKHDGYSLFNLYICPNSTNAATATILCW